RVGHSQRVTDAAHHPRPRASLQPAIQHQQRPGVLEAPELHTTELFAECRSTGTELRRPVHLRWWLVPAAAAGLQQLLMQRHQLGMLAVTLAVMRIGGVYIAQYQARLLQGPGQTTGTAAVHAQNDERCPR